jgi:hypothetical protein
VCSYYLYTRRFPGYSIHRTFVMSSRATPATPHSKVDTEAPVLDQGGKIQLHLIPLFGDNYSYLLLHPASKTMALVDPADPAPVLKVLEQHKDYSQHHTLILQCSQSASGPNTDANVG